MVVVYHSICFRLRMNAPVRVLGAWVASQMMESAPSVTDRSACFPPMSVRTQPGETAFTQMFLVASAADCWRVSAFSAVLEME